MFEEVRDIFKIMKGRYFMDENSIRLVATNKFGDKKVDCECVVHTLSNPDYPYAVDVCEKTYQLKGGRGYPCKDMKEVIRCVNESLTDFNFEEERQMSLFDF